MNSPIRNVLIYLLWIIGTSNLYAGSYVELKIEPNKDRSADFTFQFFDANSAETRFLVTVFDAEIQCAYPRSVVEAREQSKFDTLHGWYMDNKFRVDANPDLNHMLIGVEIPKGQTKQTLECRFPGVLKRNGDLCKLTISLKSARVAGHLSKNKDGLVYAEISKIALSLKDKGFTAQNADKWKEWTEHGSGLWVWDKNTRSKAGNVRNLEAILKPYYTGNDKMEPIVVAATMGIGALVFGFAVSHILWLLIGGWWQRLLFVLLIGILLTAFIAAAYAWYIQWLSFTKSIAAVGGFLLGVLAYRFVPAEKRKLVLDYVKG